MNDKNRSVLIYFTYTTVRVGIRFFLNNYERYNFDTFAIASGKCKANLKLESNNYFKKKYLVLITIFNKVVLINNFVKKCIENI
mgnify:CR=1 FL=1